MKLKFAIIPAVILLFLYIAYAQTSFITTIALNISIGDNFEIFIDTTNNRVGINNNIPNSTLHVSGTVNVTGNVTVGNKSVGVDFQRFTASGTWTKPSGVTIVIMEVVGGGGRGGNGGGGTAGNIPGGAGGGGGTAQEPQGCGCSTRASTVGAWGLVALGVLGLRFRRRGTPAR